MFSENLKKAWHMEMGDEELDFIKSYLNSNFIFFEWGSGKSTIVLSNHVREHYSIEHDFVCYEEVAIQANKNVKLYYVPPNFDSLDWFPYSPKDGSFQEFRNYIQFVSIIGSLGKKFDIVLIDGRARVECAKEILPYLSDNAVVFVHNFNRHIYWNILNYYYVEKVKDTLAVLRKKVKKNSLFSIENRIFLIENYLMPRL